jgi:hypothetical protein
VVGLDTPQALWGYSDEYSGMPMHSPKAFREACHRRGIRFLVLTPDSKRLAEFLYILYEKESSDAFVGTALIARAGAFKVFIL